MRAGAIVIGGLVVMAFIGAGALLWKWVSDAVVDWTSISAAVALLVTLGAALRRGEREPVKLLPTFVLAFELVPALRCFGEALFPNVTPHLTDGESRRFTIVAAFAIVAVLVKHLRAEEPARSAG
jgi:cytochrome bd-type quinol oxidase subunit 2